MMDGYLFGNILITLVLIIAAWARGWNGWALVPVACFGIVVLGMGIAVITQAFAVDGEIWAPTWYWGAAIAAQLLCWLALLIMAIRGRQ